MAGYTTPAWANNSAPAIDAAALTAMGQGVELGEHPYGVCSTSAGTAAKTVTIDYSGTLTLFAGLTIRVKFINRNGSQTTTLNVNGTGAVPIISRSGEDAEYATTNSWLSGEVRTLTYDGSNWILHNGVASIVRYTNVPVNVSTTASGQIMRIPASGTDPRIGQTSSVVLSISFANPSALVDSDITWGTNTGYATFSGICTQATTADVVIGTI